MTTTHVAHRADTTRHDKSISGRHDTRQTRSPLAQTLGVDPRNVVIGVSAGLVLAGVFVAVVAGTAGWQHLDTQVRDNWWLLLPLLVGFMTQVTLMWELRDRHRAMRTGAVSVGAGAGVSGAGMVACCAHHLADLAPLAGATGLATFLTDVQRPLMAVGLALNLFAVAYAARLLRRVPVAAEAGASCTR